MQIISRARRLRSSANIRSLVCENEISVNDLIMPLFVIEGSKVKAPVDSLPGLFRYSIDELVPKVGELAQLGIKAVALFPVIDESLKTKDAKEAINPNGLNQRAIKAVKEAYPDMLIMSDIALDPYSSDGHDGLVCEKTGKILNDETLEVLQQMAIVQAEAGADILGPSDMMDGRIGRMRKILEQNKFDDVLIMSYTAKYASAFYGPFRDALDSAPKSGDKKTYQMDYANADEALKELEFDTQEGADIVMVKPGLCYLDIILRFKQNSNLPVAAYNVSGEYAMVKAAAQNGWVDEKQIIAEMLTGFKRAGADIILTYFAEEMAMILNSN